MAKAAATAAPKTPPMTAAEKAMAAFTAKMQKSYGDVGRFAPSISPYRVIPTGIIDLDTKLVVGGYVIGRIHELWGAEGAGKTTGAILALVEALKAFPDRNVAYIDVEHKLDLPWCVLHGLDLSRVYLVQPNDAEEVADQVKDILTSGLFSMVVVDSIGAMIPESEKEKDADQAVMARQAQIVTRMVKIAAVEADRSDTTVLLINQVRANLSGFGNPMTSGGGFALKHVTTTKLFFKRGEPIKVGKDVIGHKHEIKIERNGVAPAFRTANFTLFFRPTDQYGPAGLDRATEAFIVGHRTGVIHQGGAWYTFTTTGQKVNGEDRAIELLRAEPEMIPEIRARALATMAHEVLTETKGEPDEDGNPKPSFSVADGD